MNEREGRAGKGRLRWKTELLGGSDWPAAGILASLLLSLEIRVAAKKTDYMWLELDLLVEPQKEHGVEGTSKVLGSKQGTQ